MSRQLSAAFVSHASEILADTNLGLSGPQIVKLTAGFAVEWGVNIPHDAYPFAQSVGNKRTALYQNLMAFSEAQRYKVIRELCEHPALRERNGQAVEKLKHMLIARYGHLAGEQLGSEVDLVLIERTQHWLGPFPETRGLYDGAAQKHANAVFLRNVLDDLRLALELLLKAILGNQKPLEKQVPLLGEFIKKRGGSSELANMFVTLVDYYTKYQNSYVKHDDAVIEEEVEFIFELTSSFMKHFVRLSYKDAV
jgi:hypothetical protein